MAFEAHRKKEKKRKNFFSSLFGCCAGEERKLRLLLNFIMILRILFSLFCFILITCKAKTFMWMTELYVEVARVAFDFNVIAIVRNFYDRFAWAAKLFWPDFFAYWTMHNHRLPHPHCQVEVEFALIHFASCKFKTFLMFLEEFIEPGFRSCG